MRKPAHAQPDHIVMAALVFEAKGRKAIVKVEGADPSSIAKAISEHKAISPLERNNIRSKIRKGLMVVQSRTIDNLDFMQLSIGNRRIRLKRLN